MKTVDVSGFIKVEPSTESIIQFGRACMANHLTRCFANDYEPSQKLSAFEVVNKIWILQGQLNPEGEKEAVESVILQMIEKNYGSGVMLQFAELVKGLESE